MTDAPGPTEADIFDRSGRLKRIGIAMLIAGVATFFTLRAMIDSGKGPQKDPVGQASVVLVGLFMFVLSAVTCLKFITRIHEQRKRMKAAQKR